MGILGGTFDPVHLAHLRLAVEIREDLRLDEVRLIPNAIPPHRARPETDTSRRLAWLRASIAGERGLVLDDRECRRSGPSYTVDTLVSLREEMPDIPLCLIMGMDSFSGLSKWHRWEILLEQAHIVVVPRPGQAPPEGMARKLLDERLVHEPERLKTRLAGLMFRCETTPLAISASDIRSRLRDGRSIRYLVPEPVWQDLQGRCY